MSVRLFLATRRLGPAGRHDQVAHPRRMDRSHSPATRGLTVWHAKHLTRSKVSRLKGGWMGRFVISCRCEQGGNMVRARAARIAAATASCLLLAVVAHAQ